MKGNNKNKDNNKKIGYLVVDGEKGGRRGVWVKTVENALLFLRFFSHGGGYVVFVKQKKSES